MTATRDELLAFLDAELEIDRFQDFGPIGLQVIGADEVERVAGAVSSTLEVFEEATAFGAQLLVVHHGLFWERSSRVVGHLLRARLQSLFSADMTLAGYHLPLDAHPVHGNNAILAERLGVAVDGAFVPHRGVPIGLHGRLEAPLGLPALAARLEQATGRKPLALAGSGRAIERVGICSGGSAGNLPAAAELGLDAYVTGEPAEPSLALARELGVALLAGGHYATETFGVKALLSLLARRFGVSTTFIDVDNPV